MSAIRRFWLPTLAPAKRLPLLYRVGHELGEHEPELVHLDRIVRSGGLAIDAGANLGFYSYRMSGLFDQVVAIEPNTGISSDLAAFDPGHIRLVRKAVSNRSGQATLYVPRQDGRMLAGWGSLDSGNLPGASHLQELDVELCSIDSLGLSSVSFVKIDVEGHEVEVLEGAQATIRRDRPRLLVEVKPANHDRVVAIMNEWGYGRVTLMELAGVDGVDDNYLFFPREDQR
ncbi:MAG: FkbM family methyltransferase [Bryobacteraceae bacterium]